MGYRSDVAIVLRKKDYKTMCKKASKLKRINITQWLNDSELYESKDNPEVYTILWSGVKWYEEYEEVQWFLNFMKKIDYAFYRIGEDYGDVEEDFGGENYEDLWNYTGITREITIDGKRIIKGALI